MANNKKNGGTSGGTTSKKRAYVRQSDIPKHSLREALTIPQAITDNFAGDPTSPHQVAIALNVSPTSSGWRSLAGAAVAYGLTKGAHNSKQIALTDLGRRCTAPTEEDDDIRARAEAALKPRVAKQFFGKYDRSKFPADQIAKNVLQQNMNVPADRLDEVLGILKDDGAFVGFVHQTKTGPFVSTEDLSPTPVTIDSDGEVASGGTAESQPESEEDAPAAPRAQEPPALPAERSTVAFRVFITHGRNKKIVDQVKDILDLYEIQYEIATEEESPAIPVPQKVLTAMRKCQSGIMIVSADDDAAAAAGAINNNVLIEIGAAFVLYDQRVVLLWDKQLKVPSNLQGLYRCEFEGGELSFAAGTKLAKAVKGFRP
jgi:predicted nucleotide-binding protein